MQFFRFLSGCQSFVIVPFRQCGHAQFAVVVRCPGRLRVVLVWCMSVVLGVL